MFRHFATAGNLEKRYIGTTDEPILPVSSVSGVPEVEIVLTSPLLRCRETAGLLYPRLDPVLIEGFRECDFGAFGSENQNLSQYGIFYRCHLSGNSGISNSGSGCGRDAVYSFWTCICSDGDASPGRKKRRGHRDGWFADFSASMAAMRSLSFRRKRSALRMTVVPFAQQAQLYARRNKVPGKADARAGNG